MIATTRLHGLVATMEQAAARFVSLMDDATPGGLDYLDFQILSATCAAAGQQLDDEIADREDACDAAEK